MDRTRDDAKPDEKAKTGGGKSYLTTEQIIWEELRRLGKFPKEPCTASDVDAARRKAESRKAELDQFRPEDEVPIQRVRQRSERAQALADLIAAEFDVQQAQKALEDLLAERRLQRALRKAEGVFALAQAHLRKQRAEARRDKALGEVARVFGLPRPLERDDVLVEEIQIMENLAKSPIQESDLAQPREEWDEARKKRDEAREKLDDARKKWDEAKKRVAEAGKPESPTTPEARTCLQADTNFRKAEREYQRAQSLSELLEAQRALEAAEDEDAEKEARRKREPKLRQYLHGLGRNALCLSGGGIRSASFSLGILQGLARCSCDATGKTVSGVLPKFQYLSTVSGGGYIGSWLTRWSAPSKDAPKHRFENSVTEMAVGGCPPDTPEACAVRNLRDYTSYLAPKRGVSGDFLALVATYLRNLLLNWMILVPFILGIALLPVINRESTSLLDYFHEQGDIFLSLAGLAAGVGMLMVAACLRAIQDRREDGGTLLGMGSATLARAHTYAFVASAILLSWWAYIGLQGAEIRAKLAAELTGEMTVPAAVLGWAAKAHLLKSAPTAASLYTGWLKYQQPVVCVLIFLAMFVQGWWRRGNLPATRRTWGYWGAYLFSAAIGAGLFYLASAKVIPRLGTGDAFVTFAVPLVLLVFLLTGTALSGLLSAFESEEDREWMARSGGKLMAWIALWIVLHALVLNEQRLLRVTSAVLVAVLGPLLSWAGFSPKTASGKTSVNVDQLNKVGKFLAQWKLLLPIGVGGFLLLLVVCAASANEFLAEKFRSLIGLSPLNVSVILLLSYLFVAVFASVFVNVNTFSMHGLYRNRLMRAYLGASRENRNPDPYTKFDPADNLPVKEAEARPDAPLHILNTTLNLVATDKLAWQERKAEPFTISPLHCGSFRLGYRRTRTYAGEKGPTLATGMAISGAAASPNMGYHSSSLVTLLMTLFNVRLGWWWPNPGRAGDRVFRKSNPRDSLEALLSEAAGKTNDSNPWIYLSDGGHFENLGLYEMVLRRCHRIVVVDGSADPSFTMEDLGNAFRKIQIDFGIPIELSIGGHIHAGTTNENRHAAVYEIRYDCVDGENAPLGELIYIKASLCSLLSEDVRHYSSSHPSFPRADLEPVFWGIAVRELPAPGCARNRTYSVPGSAGVVCPPPAHPGGLRGEGTRACVRSGGSSAPRAARSFVAGAPLARPRAAEDD